VLLLVSDGIGEPYALKHPFKLNGNLWVHKKGNRLESAANEMAVQTRTDKEDMVSA
jgi:hypothetical protein